MRVREAVRATARVREAVRVRATHLYWRHSQPQMLEKEAVGQDPPAPRPSVLK